MKSLCKTYGYGLTGNIASGKSTVANFIRHQGLTVIDADDLAKGVLEPGSLGLKKIVAAFGKDFLLSTGRLNREKLGATIFSDPDKRKVLDEITHPLIVQELENVLRQRGLFDAPRPWFYEASLLIEKGRQTDFREIWLTVCSADTRLQRLLNRSGLPEMEARQRMTSQMSDELKKPLAQTVIDTDCSLEVLETKVVGLLKAKHLTP